MIAVNLTPKEYDLLVYLAADPGAVKGREQLMHDVWDENWWGSTKTLDVHIASLRKKLDPALIETVRAVGFRLVAPRVTRRLLASYLLITVLALVLLEIPLAVFFAQRERERVAANLEHDATVIATLYEDDLENDRPLDPAAALAYHDRTGARVVVVDRQGISLVDTGGPIDRDFSTRPEITEALQGRRATGTRSSDTLATDILYVAVPVASGGTVHGALRVTIDTSDVSARIHRFWFGLAAIAIVILGLVALVGWWLARSVTRPIRQLQADAERFADGDLTVSPGPAGGPPEVRALADSIAVMATRLDELLAAQRTFVADASHQLRSPLTALQAAPREPPEPPRRGRADRPRCGHRGDRPPGHPGQRPPATRPRRRSGRGASPSTSPASPPTASTHGRPSPTRATSSCGPPDSTRRPSSTPCRAPSSRSSTTSSTTP